MYCGGDDVGAIVADIGSFSARIGFAGEDSPRAYLPTAVGVVQSEEGDVAKTSREYVFDINKYRENMAIDCPVRDGLVVDWDALEKLWEHSVSKYCGRADSSLKDTPVLMSEKPYVPVTVRHRMCETMFEKYSAPALFLSKDAVLAAYACGKTGGLVIDVGASGTVVTPVQDGWVESKGLCRSMAGGRLIDAHIRSNVLSQRYGTLKPAYRLNRTVSAAEPLGVLISEKLNLGNVHPSYDAYMTLECARDVKESLAKASDSVLQEADPRYANIPVTPYELPDGTLVEVNIERFQMAEVLFDPAPMAARWSAEVSALYAGSNSAAAAASVQAPGSMESIQKIVGDAILRSEPELQTMLLSNMMLSGGTACIDGLSERLKSEVELLMYQGGAAGYKTRMVSVGVSERALCPWLGGSIVASLGSFHEVWVTRQEYLECGTSIIDRKCP